MRFGIGLITLVSDSIQNVQIDRVDTNPTQSPQLQSASGHPAGSKHYTEQSVAAVY